MRLARYEHGGARYAGLVRDDTVHALPPRVDVLDVLALTPAEQRALETESGKVHSGPLDSVRLLPPVEPRPIRDFVAFERHIEGMKRAERTEGVPDAWYEPPVFLFMNPWSGVGAHDDVPAPRAPPRPTNHPSTAGEGCVDVDGVFAETGENLVRSFIDRPSTETEIVPGSVTLHHRRVWGTGVRDAHENACAV